MKILINNSMATATLFSFVNTKNLLTVCLLLALFYPQIQAQPDALEGKVTGIEVCPPEPCECEDFFRNMSVYYFGEDNVTIEVFRNASENQLIATFNNVNSGDLIFVDGTMTLNNRLGTYTYFRVTNAADEYCTTRIFSRCPSNAWPGALEDQIVLGHTYGDFTVFGHTDTDTNECNISDIEQDWHVGGNVVGPTNKTMGTRNDEDVIFISNDVDRGTITRTGQWGINTLAPGAQLDVQGDAIVNETLDVNGIARMNAGTSSNNPTNGALIVTGGAGISENANIGNDANVGNNLDVVQNGRIGNDLAVGRDAAVGRDLDVINNGTIGNDLSVGHDLDVTNDGAIGNDLTVGRDLDVTNDGTIGNNLDVAQDALIGNNLDVINNATVGQDLEVGRDAQINRDLDVDNDATVDRDLSVGADAAVAGNLSVNQSAIISIDVTIGDDLDVGGDAHVDGVVTIGTSSTPNMLGTVSTSAYQLFVDGGILTEEVLVRTGWADYVFESDYELMSLEELANFIAQNGHLPNVPSAQEVETNGLGLGNTAVLQQEKIEELFLHLIEMNAAIKNLQAENEALKAQVEKLR